MRVMLLEHRAWDLDRTKRLVVHLQLDRKQRVVRILHHPHQGPLATSSERSARTCTRRPSFVTRS
jgi:hypothetical protein